MRQLVVASLTASLLWGTVLAARAETATDTPGSNPVAETDPAVATPEQVPVNPLLSVCLLDAIPDRAIQSCSTAIESRQLQGEALAAALYARGMAYGRRAQLPTAINDFSAALALTPDATDVLYARGSAHAALLRHDLAVADFTAILKIEHGDTDSLYRRAWSNTMLGHDKDAVADLTAVIAEIKDDPDALMDRGGLNIRLGDYAAAITDFTSIVKQDAGAAAAFYNRGRAEMLKNDFAAAAKDFSAAQKARNDNPYAALRHYLATARAGKGDAKLLDQAIAAFPPDQWPMPILAALKGDISEADLMASTGTVERQVARRLEAEVHFYLGEAALAKKDEKAARAHFDAAARGERTVPEVIDAGWRLRQMK